MNCWCFPPCATWRTRRRPLDAVSRLCVRPALGCAVFSLVHGLPSTASAPVGPLGGLSELFGCFISTTPLSDSSPACVWPYGLGLRPAVWRCCCQTPARCPGSRAGSFPACVGSSDRAGHDGVAGEEAVLEGVLRGAGFALVGAGAGGFLGVFFVGSSLFFGCHGIVPPGSVARLNGLAVARLSRSTIGPVKGPAGSQFQDTVRLLGWKGLWLDKYCEIGSMKILMFCNWRRHLRLRWRDQWGAGCLPELPPARFCERSTTRIPSNVFNV